MSLTTVNDVPWPKLWHAYGPAVDIPETLHVLLTGDANARNEAGLYLANRVYHQGTRYSSSAAVAPFLIEILQQPEYPDKREIIELLLGLAFGLDTLAPPEMLAQPVRPEWEKLIDLQGSALEEFETRWQQGEFELEEEQIDTLAQLWVWDAYQAVATRAEVFCDFVTPNFDDPLRLISGYALAHFPQVAGKSLPLLRALLENEQAVEYQVNLLFAVALLDQATHDLKDEPRLQAFFEKAQGPLVRLAAAIALTTVQGNKVTDDVFEYLLHYLGSVNQNFDFYSWCLWNEGDLTGIAANAIKYAGRGREPIATPVLATAIQKIPPGPGFPICYSSEDQRAGYAHRQN